jgi:hypothetical protein
MRGGEAHRVGEIDSTVRLDDHVVRPVEALALETVGNYCNAAVVLLTDNAASFMLAGEQSTLQIACEPIGLVGLVLE